MKKYYNGMFYTLYWRNRKYQTQFDSVMCSIFLMGISEGLVIGGIFCLIPDCIFSKYVFISIYLAPTLFNIIYFVGGKRYKHIIRRHKMYKNIRYRRITNLFIALSFAFFFTAVLFLMIDACWL